MNMNQDWVLSEFRRIESKNDPALYSTRKMFGTIVIWLTIGGNLGWWHPEIVNGELIGIRSICFPQASMDENPSEHTIMNYAFKWIGSRQKQKIEDALK